MAEKRPLVNYSGSVQELATGDTLPLATSIHAATSKTTPVDADELGLWDSVTGLLNKLTFANLRTWISVTFAAKGANSDITSLTGLTSPITGVGANSKQQSVTATQSGGAITCGLNPTSLDFRSTTLTTGVPNTRTIAAALSLVIPSGATLGAVTTVAARLILVAIDNAGTVELAVVNIAGGNDLSETGIINTTAISAAATAATVFYSTTARTGVAYRVVGSVDAVNTAGAWGNPTLVQGYGGQALAAMNSFGYGQTWQNLTASRALSTTYYNTSGKPIEVIVGISTVSAVFFTATLSGITFNIGRVEVGGGGGVGSFIVPPGASYSVASGGTPTLINWEELRG